MKKIVSLIITVTVIASMTVMPSFTAHAAVSEDDGVIALLKELEIMQGDNSGDMRLDQKVSRAEFAKIAIALSPAKNTVAVGLKMSPFKDVSYTQWYAPYVRAAVSAGYVEGYLDATYRPDNTVTYEEAITVLLRILGYDDASFGAAYPYGQVAKAQGLELLEDVEAQIGDELTRYQVMRLAYNALQAELVASQSGAAAAVSTAGESSEASAGMTMSSGVLLQTHECTMSEDVDIIAVSEQDDDLGRDEVSTSDGTYDKGRYFYDDSVGMTGTVFVKNRKEIIAFVPDKDSLDNDGYDTYFVYSVLTEPNDSGDVSNLSKTTIIGYRDGEFENIDIKNAKVYGASSPADFALGDTLYVKRRKDNSVEYIKVDTNNFNGPLKVTSDNWLNQIGAKETSRVFRDGIQSDIASVSKNDIVYYSEPLDVVFAYIDKVTGIYEAALPNKDTPSQVRISGQTYSIEGIDAFNDLSSNGSYKYGDTITVLLGRTGRIAGVAEGSGNTAVTELSTVAGFMIEAGKKDFTNSDNTVYSSYYAKVVTPDGNVSEYATKNNCASMVCSAVQLSFKDGKATVTKQKNNSSSVSGKVSVSKGKIGDYELALDVKILDTSGTYNDDLPGYCRVYPQRIDGVKIDASSVLYYSKNSYGEIDSMILKNVTGDTYSYGVITKVDKTTRQYTIDIDGTSSVYMSNFTSNSTGPFRLKVNGMSVESMQQLVEYPSDISHLTTSEATIGGNKYLLSDKVVVYRKTDIANYMKTTLDDAINGNYKLTAYYDKQQASGGRIRIIVAQ